MTDMGYNVKLAEKLRAMLAGRKGYSEKKMFGGLSFMIDGKMCVCRGAQRRPRAARWGRAKWRGACAAPRKADGLYRQAHGGFCLCRPRRLAEGRDTEQMHRNGSRLCFFAAAGKKAQEQARGQK